MAWWDIALDIVSGLFDNSSVSKNKPGKLRKNDIAWLIEQQKQANRPDHMSPFLSHTWDDDKGVLTSGYSDTPEGQMLQSLMQNNMSRLGNRRPMTLNHQDASLLDASYADMMYDRGILDDEAMDSFSLVQDNYGTRVGDQNRELYGLNPDGSYTIPGTEDEGIRSSEFRDENQNGVDDRDEFGGPRGGSIRDPSTPGRGGDAWTGGSPGFYAPGGPGYSDNRGIDTIINDLIGNNGPNNPDNRGTPWQFELGQHGDDIGRIIGGATGQPGGSTIGKLIGNYLGNKYLNSKIWMSDGKFGGKYDYWKGEGPNPGPVDMSGDRTNLRSSMPGDQGAIDQAINDYLNTPPPNSNPGNNSRYYTRGGGEGGGFGRFEGGGYGKQLPGGGRFGSGLGSGRIGGAGGWGGMGWGGTSRGGGSAFRGSWSNYRGGGGGSNPYIIKDNH